MTGQLDLTLTPRKQFYVRKRRIGRKLYLIYLTNIYEIGPFSEKVWNACSGNNMVLSMVQQLCGGFNSESPENMETLIKILLYFKEKKLIQI
jgi:hypothetical protein